jgi:hypothetical protein
MSLGGCLPGLLTACPMTGYELTPPPIDRSATQPRFIDLRIY